MKVLSFKKELIGVFGYPVSENPTVLMYDAAFKTLGMDWQYLTIEVWPEQLGEAMQGLKAMNMRGINLTIPHKVAVMQYLNDIDESARLIGAVNTVVNNNGRLTGYNTDGKGFMTGLRQDARLSPKGLRVSMIGAGGAARAIGVECALAGVSHIHVINRSMERGKQVVQAIQKAGGHADYIPLEPQMRIPACDVLVNATSIGLYPDNAMPDVDMQSIERGIWVCDVIPNPPDTAFLQSARKRGAQTVNGLAMLVYQGALGFKLWTGKEAPVDVMYQGLQSVFGD